VVDDERLARARLRTLLEAHPGVTVVGEADSVAAAEVANAAHAPDVIFLDIAMPGGSGFDLFARVRLEADVVFVTAFDEHAIRAFEVGAVDYLLKPIEPARLADSIERLRGRPRPAPDRICLTGGGGVRVVPAADVISVRADGDYCELLLRDGTRIVQKETLTRWEQRLGPAFVRVHRDALVSLAEVERVERDPDGSTYRLLLRGQRGVVAVSRSRAATLKESLLGSR
jgi:two-component system LytT family response regulator